MTTCHHVVSATSYCYYTAASGYRCYYSYSNYDGSTTGAVIGGVIGCVVCIGIIIFCVAVVCKKCKPAPRRATVTNVRPIGTTTTATSVNAMHTANYGQPMFVQPVHVQYGQPVYGVPMGYPPPQGFGQPQGYGQPQGFGQPQDFSQQPGPSGEDGNAPPLPAKY
ncbi:uncharacterized protein LOC134275941 [Saccostrea cucullata]|uniref:uncharacterized protein LOC134275941 n=1 Tax=Saccostrea cuccullata TaxID=36930 RepID=UPI002ED36E72